MNLSVTLIAAFLALSGVSALAQGSDAQHLPRYLNGVSTDGMITFGFERSECKGTVKMLQKHEGTTTLSTLVSFNFADLSLDGFGIADYEVIGISQLTLDLTEAADAVNSKIDLYSEDPSVRETWVETIGSDAACEGTQCAATVDERQVHLIVAGPNSVSRTEFVLSDLHQLAADCSTLSE